MVTKPKIKIKKRKNKKTPGSGDKKSINPIFKEDGQIMIDLKWVDKDDDIFDTLNMEEDDPCVVLVGDNWYINKENKALNYQMRTYQSEIKKDDFKQRFKTFMTFNCLVLKQGFNSDDKTDELEEIVKKVTKGQAKIAKLSMEKLGQPRNLNILAGDNVGE